MIDILVCTILIAFGSFILAIAWLWLEGAAAIKKWKKERYKGKHIR